ncbi:MAG: DUF5107 domain-containing protein, partial [Sciscionella sp.]
MSTLRLGTLELSRALLHAGNPLPPLARVGDAHADVDATAADAEMKRNLAYGRPRSLLPYTMLDGYGRDRQPCTVDTVVLENEQLRATFLPWLGGRLWSLVHRPTDRELLYRNRVVQPANFALRDAWCSGGVEWNIATTGHSPLTSEPMHAARINLGDGTPALRLYGWERMRGVAFHVDAWLPDSSPVLLVRVGIVNPGAEETPMYWWSNIAVPEVSGVRVLAPAEQAYHFSYDKRLRLVDVPRPSGTSGIAGADITYPARAPQPGDYFFECRQASRPWIAAVDADGHGLAQVSTAALRGRKLFVWGRAAGGRHWQDFLSGGHSDQEYCEIQAGLARTQLEHLPMPAGARWSWVEAYGPLALDPAVAHGDWRAARRAVEEALTWLGSCDRIDRVLADAEDWADQEPDDTLFLGSGWGALERHRRAATDEPELGLTGMPFPDESLTTAQRPWLELLRTGRVPEVPPELPPASYVAGPDWLNLLEAAPDGW